MKSVLNLVLILMLVACNKSKPTVESPVAALENKRTSELVQEVQQRDFTAPFISLKSSVSIESPDRSNTIKASIRIKPDSVVWISASALGYEAFRLMARKDSVFLMNRTEKKYYKGSFEGLGEKIKLDINYQFLESILLGNYMGNQPNLSMKKYKDKEYYLLSTVNKGMLKKADKKGDEKPEKFDEYIFTNWIDPNSYRVERILAKNIPQNKEVQIEYANFMEMNDMKLAQEIVCYFQTDKAFQVSINYNKVNLPETLSFPFRIPSKYASY